MSAQTRVSVAVELDVSSEPIHGTLDDGAGAPIAFSGWLELMSGFETVCERARRAAERQPAESQPPSGG
ncbi:MAG: hypothetical protein QOI73_3189 [Solirubrobacteraceae bacterium]|nr:hypothetical protein [Solirubrobacteraceae bacterium]